MMNMSENVDRSGEYITDVFTEEAMKYVKDSEKPQFTYLAYNAPHFPVSAPSWVRGETILLTPFFNSKSLPRTKQV